MYGRFLLNVDWDKYQAGTCVCFVLEDNFKALKGDSRKKGRAWVINDDGTVSPKYAQHLVLANGHSEGLVLGDKGHSDALVLSDI